MTKLIKKEEMSEDERIQHVADDIKAIIGERVYRARMELIECKYEVGCRVLEEIGGKRAEYGERIKTALSKLIGLWSVRELDRCVEFARKVKDLEKFLDKVEEGKTISWNKIVVKYLPEIPPPECDHKNKIVICAKCRRKIE